MSEAPLSLACGFRQIRKCGALEPADRVRCYEWAKPREMIHVDIKKLGRFNKIGHRITGDRKG